MSTLVPSSDRSLTRHCSEEFFYQLSLTDFGNFGLIAFDPPLALTELLERAAEQERALTPPAQRADIDWRRAVSKVRAQLISRREMLAEYFSLRITAAGDVEGIPLLLRGYTPSLAGLPRFLLRLGPCVNWTDEKGCFETFLRALAAFYSPEALPPPPPPPPSSSPDAPGDAEDADMQARRAVLARTLENRIFPAVRAKMVATKALMADGGVVEVANLKGLYRVFERC